MTTKTIINIGNLYGILTKDTLRLEGSDMAKVQCIENAYLTIKDGLIDNFGLNTGDIEFGTNEIINANGNDVMPGFIDPHTHIVFADWRYKEFEMRIKGKSYEEIAEAGGGILNSANKLGTTTEDGLFESAKKRLKEMIQCGTVAIETKSGYGLNVESEIKMLRVIQRLKKEFNIPIKVSFLGAHAIPTEYKDKREKYIDLVIHEMLPIVSKENLADYMDVFCDKGFFSPEETDKLLKAAAKFGLKPKIHANELGYTQGVQVGVKNGAVSVDHLEYVGEDEIKVLQNSDTTPIALPACSFFLGIPFAPVKKMIEANLAPALATDYNPGSSPCRDQFFVWSLACIKMKLLPQEAFNAITINAAYSLGLSKELGSITKGKKANLIITNTHNELAYYPYAFSHNKVSRVFVEGE